MAADEAGACHQDHALHDAMTSPNASHDSQHPPHHTLGALVAAPRADFVPCDDVERPDQHSKAPNASGHDDEEEGAGRDCSSGGGGHDAARWPSLGRSNCAVHARQNTSEPQYRPQGLHIAIPLVKLPSAAFLGASDLGATPVHGSPHTEALEIEIDQQESKYSPLQRCISAASGAAGSMQAATSGHATQRRLSRGLTAHQEVQAAPQRSSDSHVYMLPTRERCLSYSADDAGSFIASESRVFSAANVSDCPTSGHEPFRALDLESTSPSLVRASAYRDADLSFDLTLDAEGCTGLSPFNAHIQSLSFAGDSGDGSLGASPTRRRASLRPVLLSSSNKSEVASSAPRTQSKD